MSKQWAIWSAIALAAAASGSSAIAQEKIKVGFMLPFSGTYAALGVAIENGFRMQVAEQGGKLGGREIEYFKVDDESDPAKATDNVNRLIKQYEEMQKMFKSMQKPGKRGRRGGMQIPPGFGM